MKKVNRNGFTLIELLAVIVILAIIDYSENKYSDLMLPRWLYYDLLYEHFMAQLTGTEPSTNGYWTKTPVASLSDYAWGVHFAGNVHTYYVEDGDYVGVRPVIKLSDL